MISSVVGLVLQTLGFRNADSCLMKPEIMVGKLGVGFGRDPFTSGRRVMRQGHIFLVKLLGVSAELYIRAV
jgi:hypothetical protein